ncbi:MAG: protein kinase [Planctomycetota bacterium]
MRVGPYELSEQLGRGGMGTVWRGRHVELGVERAVKLFDLRGPAALERFRRETQHLARVRHRNVVGIHEAEVQGQQGWFAMDLVQGTSLRALLDVGGRLPLARVVSIGVGVADGLAALHALGVAHRDLKPENVVLQADDTPVLIDLGLAIDQAQDARLTQTGALLGTLHYMAPEQLAGGASGPPADVFAWALLVAELALGELPERISAVETPRAPSRSDARVPLALDALLARAWALDPGRRPPIEELRAQLAALDLAGPRRRRALALALVGSLGCAALALAAVAALGAPPASSAPPPAPSAPPSSARPDRAAQALQRAHEDVARGRPTQLLERLRALPAAALARAEARELLPKVLGAAVAAWGPDRAGGAPIGPRELAWLAPAGLLARAQGADAGALSDAVLAAALRRAQAISSAEELAGVLEGLSAAGLKIPDRQALLVMDLLGEQKNTMARQPEPAACWRLLRVLVQGGIDPTLDQTGLGLGPGGGGAPRRPGEEPDAVDRYLEARKLWALATAPGVTAYHVQAVALRELPGEVVAALHPMIRIVLARYAVDGLPAEERLATVLQAVPEVVAAGSGVAAQRLEWELHSVYLTHDDAGRREAALGALRRLLPLLEASLPPEDLLECPTKRLVQEQGRLVATLALLGEDARAAARLRRFDGRRCRQRLQDDYDYYSGARRARSVAPTAPR